MAATISYNVIEAAVALTAGAQASSTALIGFGLDSVIEVSSAAAVAWQFSKPDHEAREKAALRIIALSFFALAAYVTVESVRALFGYAEPRPSIVGIVLAAVSLMVMPLLSWAQRRTGRELGSRSAVADSKQTLLCTYLSAVLLFVLRTADQPQGPWSTPITIATSLQYPGLYAPMIHPLSGTGVLTDSNGNPDVSNLYWDKIGRAHV